jgi:hypothetical protein
MNKKNNIIFKKISIMKFFSLLFIYIPMNLFSQVELISIDASKFYPNGTQITYLTLSDYPTDKKFIDFTNSHLTKDNRIYRFLLSEDGKSCFLEADKDVTNNHIIDEINKSYHLFFNQVDKKREITNNTNNIIEKRRFSNSIESSKTVNKPSTSSIKPATITPIDISQKEESTTVRRFRKSDFHNQNYRVGFKLEDNSNIDNVKKATEVLQNTRDFEKIDVVEDIHFELSSFEPISADFVIGIFEEFGLKIEEEYIK